APPASFNMTLAPTTAPPCGSWTVPLKLALVCAKAEMASNSANDKSVGAFLRSELIHIIIYLPGKTRACDGCASGRVAAPLTAGRARSSLARRNAARNPDSNFHLSSILRLTSLASSLYKINQRLEAPLFERPLHTLHHIIARTRSPVLAGNRYSESEYKVFAAV